MSQSSHSWIEPADLAGRVEEALLEKAGLSAGRMVVLGVMAGAYIALGGLFATIALAEAEGQVPYGIAQVTAGLVFSLGLVLVVVAGAELFTGNALMVGPLVSGRLTLVRILRNWSIVYVANFIGSLAVAAMVFVAEVHAQGQGSVGRAAVSISAEKTDIAFGAAFASGIAANALVCLAIWLAYSASTTTDKVFAVLLPIAAFVAAGLEHSIANMYLIPYGLLVHLGAPELSNASTASLTVGGLFANLVPVTLGNIVGGGLVGVGYAVAHLRGRADARHRGDA